MRKQIPAALAFLFVISRAAHGQGVIVESPSYDVPPPALRPVDAGDNAALPLSPVSAGYPRPPFSWGPIRLRPHFSCRFLYGDGIQSSPGNRETTAIHQLAPGMLLELGDHWNVDYTPTSKFYSSDDFRDTLDHSVSLIGGAQYRAWNFGISQRYDASSDPLIETGTQTDQEYYLTAFSAAWQLNRRMSVDLGANQNLRFAQEFNSSREWSTMDWFNYEILPGLVGSVGLGFGYVDVEVGIDMMYQMYQGRLSWRATDKTSFLVHGGIEDRQMLADGADDLINPLAGVSIQYQPFAVTRISVSLNRVVSTSLLRNQVTENTDFRIDLSQRLLKRFHLNLGGGYQTVTYVSSTDTEATGREDEHFSFDARLGCALLKRGTVAISYRFSDNSSTQTGFAYSSTQFGVEFGYRY